MTLEIIDIEVLNNPAPFNSLFSFRITFDCFRELEEVEWKLTYVGCADDASRDQELDSVIVGPIRKGRNRFPFEAPGPDLTLIPSTDLLDVTVILLTCLYRDQEFIRIGYYVSNEYPTEADEPNPASHEQPQNQKPEHTESANTNTNTNGTENETGGAGAGAAAAAPVSMLTDPSKIIRNILADKPRVTRFAIKWHDTDTDTDDADTSAVVGEAEEAEEEAEGEEEAEAEAEAEPDADIAVLGDDDDEEEEEEEEDDEETADEEDIADEEEEEDQKEEEEDDDEDEDEDMTVQ